MIYQASSSLSCVLQRLQGRLGCIPVKHSRHHEDRIIFWQQSAMLK
jgi:hypothetical protein